MTPTPEPVSRRRRRARTAPGRAAPAASPPGSSRAAPRPQPASEPAAAAGAASARSGDLPGCRRARPAPPELRTAPGRRRACARPCSVRCHPWSARPETAAATWCRSARARCCARTPSARAGRSRSHRRGSSCCAHARACRSRSSAASATRHDSESPTGRRHLGARPPRSLLDLAFASASQSGNSPPTRFALRRCSDGDHNAAVRRRRRASRSGVYGHTSSASANGISTQPRLCGKP